MNTTIEEKRRLSSDFLFHLFSISKFFDPLIETESYVFRALNKMQKPCHITRFSSFPFDNLQLYQHT